MKKNLVFAILFPCLLLLSCTKDSMNLEEIDSDIIISMVENLHPKKRSLAFFCYTENYYPLGNYGISYNLDKNFKNIKIRFNGIRVPDGGPTSVEPAKALLDLGTLANGKYPLTVDVSGKISTGQLIVSSTRYVIDLNQKNMLQIANSPLNRIPVNTIWGNISYISDSLDPVAQDFLDLLKTKGAMDATWHPGDYGHFTICPASQILPPDMPGSPFYIPFIFHYLGDKDALLSFVKEFGKPHSPYLFIMLYTSCGKEQGSWWP